jgi:hypothetical protein
MGNDQTQPQCDETGRRSCAMRESNASVRCEPMQQRNTMIRCSNVMRLDDGAVRCEVMRVHLILEAPDHPPTLVTLPVV